ncbi:hypothetical protein BWQ96_07241 [Gracilariopsis chorda]|uniref:Uncharacterized protein n=1 Tax=Gracilariopsis chorda TaxID=448386 RepID=A0A2V3ILQ9_9FLOR|nr:hypothetical protein BWQ96_07241 [Gracilariopsis chorda]|eukprot:PXF42993.1 hypothetical protein BWQ96_07241 [Gracilariopsis chorda]
MFRLSAYWITVISALFTLTIALPVSESRFRAFRVGLSSEGYTSAVALTTDDHGNTYVVGNTNGSFGKADGQSISADSIFIAKFSRSGIMIWLRRTGSAYLDKATSIFYYGKNVYVTGSTMGTVRFDNEAGGTDYSQGIKDGFVLAYNAFTGRRQWSRQFGREGTVSEVKIAVVSRTGGVVIAGHTNASLFTGAPRNVKHDEFFLVRLNYATGRTERKLQVETKETWPFSNPQRLVVAEEMSVMYAILHTPDSQGRKAGVVVSVGLRNYRVMERVMDLGDQVAAEGRFYGLAHDKQTGRLGISYTQITGNSDLSNYALRIVTNNTRPRQVKEVLFTFDKGGRDVARDVVVNNAGFALVLGTSSDGTKRRSNESIPALWVYDLRQMKTVGSFVGRQLEGIQCNKITAFDLDSNGNIVYAGVRQRRSGTREVLLGSFGMAPELKWRSEDEYENPQKIYILENGTTTTDEMLAIQDAKQAHASEEVEDGVKLSIGAIASISIGSALVILALAGAYAFVMKRKHERLHGYPLGIDDPEMNPDPKMLFNEL